VAVTSFGQAKNSESNLRKCYQLVLFRQAYKASCALTEGDTSRPSPTAGLVKT